MTREIAVCGGYVAFVDDEDFDLVSSRSWYANVHQRQCGSQLIHAVASTTICGRDIKIMMHRLIMKAPRSMLVDHRDTDGLNNRRANLRLCNYAENAWNTPHVPRSKSGFRGVKVDGKRFRATICQRGERIHLGCFETPAEAAVAYDSAVRRLRGDFAILNFPNTEGAARP